MKTFKRNQIEEAIARLSGQSGSKSAAVLRTRIKRLLDTDRHLGRNLRSKNPEESQYAFYNEDAPGKGVEVWFSEYEAFAVQLGLRLMGHGWPQTFAVSVLRQQRSALEAQHRRILKQNPSKLFDQTEIMKRALPGALIFNNTDPVFLVIASPAESAQADFDQLSVSVCHGPEEVSRFQIRVRANSTSFFELATPAFALHEQLARTEPRVRGRGS